MSGIYIHIPFCRQACHYCNFHFSVSLKQQEQFVACLLREIELQAAFFDVNTGMKAPIDTVYLGGGTPSVLDAGQLESIFRALSDHFVIADAAEITLEANPDDLSKEKLHMLGHTPVNRLSIGIQSFFDADLKYMNRIHSSVQALEALGNAHAAGFRNINIDLIYATPTLSDQQWVDNLTRVVSLKIPHISAYALTVEKQTALEVMIRKGKATPVDEEQTARQFDIMVDVLQREGYHHYEISNFALPGQYAQHNMTYWTGGSYLGLGPSAHSFKPGQRWWNISNTTKFIQSLKAGRIPSETEVLTTQQQYDEYLMTSLRTMWGCDLSHIERQWGRERLTLLMQESGKYIEQGLMEEKNSHLILTSRGKLFADGIAADLFWV